MNPNPNLPTFKASSFLGLWLILAIAFQSCFSNIASFQAYKAGPWYWPKFFNFGIVSFWSCFLESVRNRTSVAPASSAFWISSYNDNALYLISEQRSNSFWDLMVHTYMHHTTSCLKWLADSEAIAAIAYRVNSTYYVPCAAGAKWLAMVSKNISPTHFWSFIMIIVTRSLSFLTVRSVLKL